MRYLVAVLMLLALGACKKQAGEPMFDKLLASDLGLKFQLLESPPDVKAKLGPPGASSSSQGGASSQDFYLPPSVTSTDRNTPQLSLTYVSGKLVRVFNRYYPDDSSRPMPPFFIAALPGIKLGAPRTAFMSVLGPPAYEGASTEWRFQSKDGRAITILAQFTNVASAGRELCSTLEVVFMEAVEESRGEEYEKKPPQPGNP